MTENHTINRIPAEEAKDARPWVLPPVSDNGRVLSSAEKEARERRDALLRGRNEKIEVIDIPEPPPAPGISAEDMQAMFDSAEKEGFTQGHKEGFAKGNAEGYEAGRQQGLMEMRAQLVAEQQRFQKLASALLHPVQEQDDDLEQLLLDVICTLTQSVVQRELLTDSSQILELVRKAVDALPVGSKNIRISLNPDDLAAVEAYADEQQLDWKFHGDNSLQPGGCRIETPDSRVDYSVSTRLQTLLEQFVSQQLAASDEPGLLDEAPDDSVQPAG
ncbi:flagellar assembly protein FliH [Cellvibrio japonicus]|uniref:Flagellar assembly protein FliH n=1 Tax=Cellvibrio japonicus (strain Ueda107) TaxID=498211 RepID=B3PEY9_CELJU|nr:flagellar assembly protein FliH [Cellvibrio japonicus]ACE85183.1 Flagellar assembly protein FliH [Cellvibrio japonicus Ueda107]QEI12235.1 flagellar assembly protein FliH [Cellvibrio japonicus]QEI15809.1 flagellar assembly protein FliH [Cellvibrio japonicus]QEI19387.1 flagellar assembly protein FliH [Cellvibrio japonicus]